MTRQKDPSERRHEILTAALEVLDEQGLAGFSMEAVIARTPLSKGGVYRFYANRQELLADVFRFLAESIMPADPGPALTWDLPLRETLHRLLFASFHREGGLCLWRIHMRLMPELPRDEALLASARRSFDAILDKYLGIVLGTLQRDGLALRSGAEQSVAMAICVGQSLFDGLVMNHLGGLPLEEMERRMDAFIDLVIRATVEE